MVYILGTIATFKDEILKAGDLHRQGKPDFLVPLKVIRVVPLTTLRWYRFSAIGTLIKSHLIESHFYLVDANLTLE